MQERLSIDNCLKFEQEQLHGRVRASRRKSARGICSRNDCKQYHSIENVGSYIYINNIVRFPDLSPFNVNVNAKVNIYNALAFPKEQKCGYLLWSIEAKMVQVCFELRLE